MNILIISLAWVPLPNPNRPFILEEIPGTSNQEIGKEIKKERMGNKVGLNKLNTTVSNWIAIPLEMVWNMPKDYSTRVQENWSI